MLDTTVYIDQAANRIGPTLREGIERALLFHCSVALSELSVGVANADPKHPGWRRQSSYYARLFTSIPASRLLAPDQTVWVDAGVIAGMLSRTQRLQPNQRREFLNDVLIFLTAAKIGVPVLTANHDDFDLIQQIAPEGEFIYYATVPIVGSPLRPSHRPD